MAAKTFLNSLVALCSGVTLAAQAQTEPLGLNQTAWIELQGLSSSVRSSVRLDRTEGGAAGTTISFEDDLGLAKRKTLGSLLAGARFGPDWRVEFEHYSLQRAGREELDAAITVDNTVFDTSVSIRSEFDTRVYRGSVGHSFYRTPSAEAGASLGLHVTQVRVLLEGVGSVDGAAAVERQVVREKTVPLPTIGLYSTVALSDAWLLNARADLLFLKVKESKGLLLNLSANAIYRFTPHLGVGGGYRYVDYELRRSSGTARGEFKYRYSGPQLFIDFGF
jgi:hypothetical protein